MYGLYYSLLRPQKSFTFNRFFLLFSLGFSLIIPFLNFQFLIQPQFITDLISEGRVPIHEISVLEQKAVLRDAIITPNTSKIKLIHILSMVYSLGFGFFLSRFIKNLTKIYRNIKTSSIVKCEGYQLVLVDNCYTIYSFNNSIFINRQLYPDKIDNELFKHELEHTRQYHSLDIIIAEVFKIIYWFNPISIFYGKAIRANHEFLADDRVLKNSSNIRDYSNKLLQYISARSKACLVSGFNQSLAKDRIIMMSKPYKTFVSNVRILILLPIISLIVLLLSSFTVNRQGTFSIHGFREYSDSIYLEVDQMPVFNQEYKSFESWVASELIYPEEAIQKGITGNVGISFLIEIDGSVSNVKAWRSVYHYLDNEAIRIVSQSPKWIPGQVDDDAVRTYCTVYVKFNRPFINDLIDTKNIKLKRVYSNN